ncbi:acyl-coenzyme A thioesterase 13 isoform X1 [Pyrus x bretschneideri]|uniref:acyl-coenzyme A thioesterase 13 isoform X1 n=1 Tax=Pyrus x bretschneideri TaxID=225117 RepID=UPI000511329E|nr:acyl-coenzyme A thioesterase 13 isoform X1 [Pyrus x bretschneideri]
MEKAKKRLELNSDESETVSRVAIPALQIGKSSFYEAFALRGILVERVEPGVVLCSFKVPPRLVDRDGKLANGAIANLVDIVGASVAYIPGLPMNVSVDISVSYVSTAKLHDELEITSRVLGRTGGYCGTMVTFRNKSTGEIIAEGRHSLFRSNAGLVPKL